MRHSRSGAARKLWRKRWIAAVVAVFTALLSAVAGADQGVQEENGDRIHRYKVPKELRIVIDPGIETERSVVFRTDETTDKKSETLFPESTPCKTDSYRPNATLRLGYRNDTLSWSIAGPDNTPNVLSELEWEGIESIVLSGTVRWSNHTGLYLRGSGSAGWVVDGGNRDSDYLGDDRTDETSRSYAATDNGSMYNAVIGAGYRITLSLGHSRMHIIPLGGWSIYVQELEDTDGVQIVADHINSGLPLGSFEGLQSTYEAMWEGPWAGLDLELASGSGRHGLTASFEYHWNNYEGEADWNLRKEFQHPVSFRHDAKGEGMSATLDYRYSPDRRRFWTLGGSYRNMTTDPGRERIYFSGGTRGNLRLNKAKWVSYSVSIGFGFHF